MGFLKVETGNGVFKEWNLGVGLGVQTGNGV